MPNSLLDFVVSLVRDPAVAAAYAADPAAVMSAAGLTGVTTADVANLVPMVSESWSASTVALPGADANVWTGGGATAALDAFGVGDQVPVTGVGMGDPFDVPVIVGPPLSGATTGIDDLSADLPTVGGDLGAGYPREAGIGETVLDGLEPTEAAVPVVDRTWFTDAPEQVDPPDGETFDLF